MSLLPKVLIERPPSAPAKFGVLSAAVVRDSTDPHEAAGVTWDQEACGGAETVLADCLTAVFEHAFSIDVDTARGAAVSNFYGGTGPDGMYTIDWGDGTVQSFTRDDGPPTHTYAADGDYTVVVTGPESIITTDGITVTNGDATGPFNGDSTYIPDLFSDARAGWVESEPFNLYHLSECRLPGLTHDERVAYARRGLSLGEGRGIEQYIGGWFSTTDPGGFTVTVLASGAAASWTVALARLEAYAFQNYGGTAIIYMHRTVASVLLGTSQLEASGDKLLTKLGSLVIAGTGTSSYAFPGFPDGETTDGSNTWMFATGTLLVTRGPVSSTQEVISNSAVSDDGISGAYDNDYLVLATRDASVGFECFIAAHQVLEVNDADLPSLAKDEV